MQIFDMPLFRVLTFFGDYVFSLFLSLHIAIRSQRMFAQAYGLELAPVLTSIQVMLF